MSTTRMLLLTLMWGLVGVTLVVRGATTRSLDLAVVAARAVCPIEVVVDEDPRRTPRRIKLLKCARAPLATCLAGNVSRDHCCDWRTDTHVAGCVEILDYVAVSYRGRRRRRSVQPLPVAVGCACVPLPITQALED